MGIILLFFFCINEFAAIVVHIKQQDSRFFPDFFFYLSYSLF